MFIKKRYPKLVYITNISTIIAVIAVSVLNSIKQLSPLQTTNPIAFNIVGRTLNIFGNITIYAIQCTLLCRFWLMFYDLNYSNSNMNKQWKSHLDITLIDKDFWLKNKDKLGSLSYSLKIAFIGIIIFSSPPIIYAQIYFPAATAVTNFITLPLHIIMLIMFIILSWKSPQILDLFYMRFELKCLAVLILLGSILSLTANPLYNSENDTMALIGRIYRMDIGIVVYALLTITSTWFILKKLDPDTTYNKKYTQQSQRQKSLELQRVLLDPRNFELFIQHLAREFSVEIILCFIEMVQFKHLINYKFNINAFGGRTISQSQDITIDQDEELDEKTFDREEMQKEIYFDFIQCDITKNASIPKAFIVYKSDHTQRDPNDITPFLKIVYKLYNKYIKIGGELEINICGETRDIFINDMECPIQVFIDKQLNNDNAMEAVDLFEYFDCIIEEMYCLLASSCDRFLETDKNVNIARIHLTHYNMNQIENTLHGGI